MMIEMHNGMALPKIFASLKAVTIQVAAQVCAA
jgi:hypothetical protein